MPKTRISCLLLLVIAFELTSCKPNEEEKKVPEYWESPAVLDFDAIKKEVLLERL